MKTILVYASTHHGNTLKVAEAIAREIGAELADVTKEPVPDLSSYDLVGFASGIYFNSFHKALKSFINGTAFSNGQKVFLVATCGAGCRDYTAKVKKVLREKGACCVGSFQCRGYDTYGIWGKLGGIAKGHPNEKDLEKARGFARNTVKIS